MDKFNVNESLDTARLEKLFLENGMLKILRKNEYMVRQNDKTNHIGSAVKPCGVMHIIWLAYTRKKECQQRLSAVL